MRQQELQQIYYRYFKNSPGPINPDMDLKRFNKNLANRKPSKRFGELIWNSQEQGTFVGNLRRTFKY